VIERSGGAVCGLHRARGNEEHEFLGSASKPRSTICEWFDLKITRTVFTGLASKPVVTVSSGLGSKPAEMVSDGLGSKPVVGFLVEFKITVVEGFPVWASKPAVTVRWFGP
jgi:hypothetical protein